MCVVLGIGVSGGLDRLLFLESLSYVWEDSVEFVCFRWWLWL